MTISEKVKKVRDLYRNTPDGRIVDSDTILKDLTDNADMEVTDVSMELLDIWENAADREAVESLFLLFTDTEFEDYVDRCIRTTTR